MARAAQCVGRRCRWAAAAFLIRGEAGIGKTRLAEELVDWCGLQNIRAVAARCYAGEGRLAYAPIAAWLKSDALQPTLMKLDASWLTDVSRLRPELLAARPEVPAPDRQLESWQRLRFFEALAQAFRSADPLVLVLDDLQWADGDTIEWLQYFLRSASDTRCLVVGTVRAEEEQDNPPLGRLLGHLERDGLLTAIVLGPLDQAATAQLAGEVVEHELDEAALDRTFRETEGHPLFIVERGRMELARQPGASSGAALPQVQSVVAARLALLSEEARAAAEVAAAVGRDFRFDILARASDLEEDALVRALDELWRRHIVRVQADERWDFSHDRIREVAYGAIGPARRRLIHRRIAQGMELLFANRLDEVSASIAAHLDRGGQPARAIPFLERAAAVATRVSATEEAIRCLTYALSLLERLPAGRDRDEQELALRSSLSVALNSARGYAAPEIEQNLESRVPLVARRRPGTGAGSLAVGGVHAPLHARRPERHARSIRAGARVQRVRSVVPLRGASCDGRHAVERRRARGLAPSLRGVARWRTTSGIHNGPLLARTSASSRMPGTRRRSGCLATSAPRSHMSSRQWRWRGGSITCTAWRSRSHTPHSFTRCAAMPIGCSSAPKRLSRSASGTDSATTETGPASSSGGRAGRSGLPKASR